MLVAFAGWRQWVLGAWKIPTERTDAIVPRLRETTFRFGPPCAIIRDLGQAMTEAAGTLVKDLKLSIPVLACHLHFLSDVGKDLLEESHDRLRGLFRQSNVRSQLRTLARSLGRNLGRDIDDARAGLRRWQTKTGQAQRIPTGSAGVATVRALTQWILDYPADTHGDGFPFDLPWLALYDRCLQAVAALEEFLADPPEDSAVRKPLERLRRILQPVEDNGPQSCPSHNPRFGHWAFRGWWSSSSLRAPGCVSGWLLSPSRPILIKPLQCPELSASPNKIIYELRRFCVYALPATPSCQGIPVSKNQDTVLWGFDKPQVTDVLNIYYAGPCPACNFTSGPLLPTKMDRSLLHGPARVLPQAFA